MADAIPIPAVLPPNHNIGLPLVYYTWTMLGVSTAFLAARLYAKIFRNRSIGLDDMTISFVWVCALLYSVCVTKAVHYGAGRHYLYLTPEKVLKIITWEYVGQLFLYLGPTCGRTSVGLYLLAIIGKSRHALKTPLWVAMGVQIVLNVIALAMLYGVCGSDISIIGNVKLTCYTSRKVGAFSYFVGALDVVTDAFLALAPTYMIWRLRTRPWVKYAAIALLSLTGLPMAAALWRTIEIRTIFRDNNWDFSYGIIQYFLASTLELNLIIIGASIPTLGPLFKRRHSVLHSTTTSSRDSGEGAEIRHNLGQALGMNFAHLGNTVTITAGPHASSQEEILPMKPLPNLIKASRRVVVEHEVIQTMPPYGGFAKY
ncbi:hypothetical protein LTR36_004795 [Oleoguttula mirabilis]|uniref:Rhodopsin domain-containing protein n=1 Tax=Oleoguttula mirabilis TaxID=1507867 RepID=A0AAV9JF54_9PEZI|nr:hypothetical protein LTR36_004795 [Oleoguttula mirabilis]